MASLLESAIKKAVAAGFKGRLCKGILRRETVIALDDFGDSTPDSAATFKFDGIRESFDAAYAQRAGIPVTDVSILIILGSISTTPVQNDKLYIGKPFFKWHQVRRILEVDPAGASMRVQAFEIVAPDTVVFSPSLDFSDARNSGYLPVIGA